MTEHAVVIAGGGPTGLMLAGELALAGVDVAIVERRVSQDLVGSRAGGLHSRTIEALDQRGIADRFLSQGQLHKVVHFHVPLDISDFPTRHNYVLSTWSPPAARCASSHFFTMRGRCYSTSLSPAASTSPHGRIAFTRSTPSTSLPGRFRQSARSLLPPPC